MLKKAKVRIQNPMLNGVSVRFRSEVQTIENRTNSGFLCLFSVFIKDKKKPNDYKNDYNFEIKIVNKNYTDPKLFIPTELINGKKVACVGPKKTWYVWFRYKKKMFTYKNGLNKFKTVKERRNIGNTMVIAYSTMLQRGWNPNDNTYKENTDRKLTLEEGLKLALKNRVVGLKQSTVIDYSHRLTKFLDYCDTHFISGIGIDQLTKKQFSSYLNAMAVNGASNTSIANDKRAISALFGKLVGDFIIEVNPLAGLKVAKSKPTKNKAFTVVEIKTIIEHLQKTDPKLIDFIQFLVFALLRPTEVVRIKLNDFKNDILTLETKTDNVTYIKIIDKLQPTANRLINLTKDPDHYLFTNNGVPGTWPINEKSRYDHFNRRFKAAKDYLEFGSEYGLYSFRHSAIYALYSSFINEGKTEREAILKLLPITRHRSEEALKKYLREIGANLPLDYGDRFNFEL